jgi:hypothetical protein
MMNAKFCGKNMEEKGEETKQVTQTITEKRRRQIRKGKGKAIQLQALTGP